MFVNRMSNYWKIQNFNSLAIFHWLARLPKRRLFLNDPEFCRGKKIFFLVVFSSRSFHLSSTSKLPNVNHNLRFALFEASAFEVVLVSCIYHTYEYGVLFTGYYTV